MKRRVLPFTSDSADWKGTLALLSIVVVMSILAVLRHAPSSRALVTAIAAFFIGFLLLTLSRVLKQRLAARVLSVSYVFLNPVVGALLLFRIGREESAAYLLGGMLGLTASAVGAALHLARDVNQRVSTD